MTNHYLIIISFVLTISSCGTRSGVSPENGDPACGVINDEPQSSIPRSGKQISGQKLFLAHCSQCHSITTDQNGMKGITERMPQGNWFKHFIWNSDSLKKSGEPYTLKIIDAYASDYEHRFKSLSGKDLEDIYDYLKIQQ